MITITIIYTSLLYNDFYIDKKDIERQQQALQIEQEKLYNLINK